MSAIAYALREIIERSQEKLTKREAENILRRCGIFDRSNKIQPAYVNIVVPKDQKKIDL